MIIPKWQVWLGTEERSIDFGEAKIAFATWIDWAPLTRITPSPPSPSGVAMAAMVSCGERMGNGYLMICG